MDVSAARPPMFCIGIAIDSMIHSCFRGSPRPARRKESWAACAAARVEQWRGIVYSDVIIAAGFAFSSCPIFPTPKAVRFGWCSPAYH